MQLEFQLSLADLKTARRLHKPSLVASRAIGFLASIGLVALGGALSLAAKGQQAGFDLMRWAAVALWVGGVLLALQVVQAFIAERLLRRAAASQEHTTVVVSDLGFEAVARGAKSQIEWQRICGAKESADCFLLYISRDRYLVFPKRAFADAAAISRFATLATRRPTSG